MRVQREQPTFQAQNGQTTVNYVTNLFCNSVVKIISTIDRGIIRVVGMHFPGTFAMRVREVGLNLFNNTIERRVADLKAILEANPSRFMDLLVTLDHSLETDKDQTKFFTSAKGVIAEYLVDCSSDSIADIAALQNDYPSNFPVVFGAVPYEDQNDFISEIEDPNLKSVCIQNAVVYRETAFVKKSLQDFMDDENPLNLKPSLMQICMRVSGVRKYLMNELEEYRDFIESENLTELEFLKLMFAGEKPNSQEELIQQIEEFEGPARRSQLTPNLTKFDIDTTERGTTHGFATSAGVKKDNEDTCIVLNRDGVTVSGVFDGHMGVEASRFVAQSIAEMGEFEDYNSEKASFIHQEIQWVLENEKKIKDGTCAIYAIREGENLVVVNVGDSFAFLVAANGEVLPCSLVSDCKDPFIVERAARRGIIIGPRGAVSKNAERPLPVELAVASEFGRLGYAGTIPDVYQTTIGDSQMLILASDGLYDAMSPEDVAAFAKNCKEEGFSATQTAQQLCEEALKRGSIDNVSVVIDYLDQE